ncbi:MAG: hypothetical protein HY951_08815 [Bacteroidia bacterium]|nr:hypothetical protein [Bacteroidia bacterium]
MNNWIEEAEKRQKDKDSSFTQEVREESEIIKDNHEKLIPFITKLNDLIDRVSRISPEERKPSIEIGSTHLSGDLKYEFFGSAFQTKEKRIALIIKKNKNYIFWRRFYISVTDTSGLIKITIYEKGTSQTNPDDVIKRKMKLLTKIDSCNDASCFNIIDWLVFKISSNDLKRLIPHLHH